MSDVVLVDSGLANLFSVEAALARLGVSVTRSDKPEDLAKAPRVILPGVGAAAPAMEGLRKKGLDQAIKALSCPVLGICLGMQLLFERSEEGEGAEGLGVLSGAVTLLPSEKDKPVPHMGWNALRLKAPEHPLFKGVEEGSFVYFVHSYAVAPSPLTLAEATYTAPFTAAAGQGNFMGCQFHPERSGAIGSRILKNFLEM